MIVCFVPSEACISAERCEEKQQNKSSIGKSHWRHRHLSSAKEASDLPPDCTKRIAYRLTAVFARRFCFLLEQVEQNEAASIACEQVCMYFRVERGDRFALIQRLSILRQELAALLAINHFPVCQDSDCLGLFSGRGW